MLPTSLPKLLGTLVHAGTGTGEMIDRYSALGFARLILIEPDPDQAQQLRLRTAGDEAVTVFEAALVARAEKDQTATLFRYGLESLNSLRPAKEIMRLYPGLKLRDEVVVAVCDVAAFLARAGLDGGRSNGLLLQTNGEEQAILQALSDQDALGLFPQIMLQAGAPELYEKAAGTQDLSQMLKDFGYEDVTSDPGGDPDRPFQIHHRPAALVDPAAMEALTREIAELRTSEEATGELLRAARARSADLEQEISWLKGNKTDLEAETARVKGESASLAAQVDTLTARCEALQADKDNLKARAEAAQDNLGLTLRQQVAARRDLAELQERYAVLSRDKEAQDALLGQVTDKLRLAAEQLQASSAPAAPTAEVSTEADKQGGHAKHKSGAAKRKSLVPSKTSKTR